jgi:hypothetical protein
MQYAVAVGTISDHMVGLSLPMYVKDVDDFALVKIVIV